MHGQCTASARRLTALCTEMPADSGAAHCLQNFNLFSHSGSYGVYDEPEKSVNSRLPICS